MGRAVTHGSLFAGIGGFDLGFERAGIKTIWQVENNPFCRAVLAKHWPDVLQYGDIRDVDFGVLERPDIISGGFPCQPVSDAGLRKGVADERWLWPVFAGTVRDIRPRYVVVESTRGILGRGFGYVLGDLAALGYDAEWEVLPAEAFGAPHLRERVFVVATSRGHPVLFRREARRSLSKLAAASWWADEPGVARVAYGVPARVDRLRALGNAVVPQVAEFIGRKLIELDEVEKDA